MTLGIVCSVLPLLLTIMLYFLTGNFAQDTNSIKMEIIPDLLLVAFAIAINTVSVLLDNSNDDFFVLLKGFITAISALIGFAAFYSVFGYITSINNIMFEIGNIEEASDSELYEASIKISKAKDMVMSGLRWDWYTIIAIAIIIVNVLIGCSAIYRTYFPKKVKESIKIKKNETNKGDTQYD